MTARPPKQDFIFYIALSSRQRKGVSITEHNGSGSKPAVKSYNRPAGNIKKWRREYYAKTYESNAQE